MKIFSLATICLICSISAIILASAETIYLGPAQISLDLKSLGSYSVDVDSSSSMDHNEREADFMYKLYTAKLTSNGTSDQVLIEIHEISTPMPLNTSVSRKDTSTGLQHCLEKSDLIPGMMDLQTKPYQIDGHEGVLAQIGGDGKNYMYIVAYSPDEKDGSGRFVCVVGSNFPWETTKAIFDSLKTKVA
jgi:hypothetical protein